jgi:hypothetical protein
MGSRSTSHVKVNDVVNVKVKVDDHVVVENL